jgi:hypothetical protein
MNYWKKTYPLFQQKVFPIFLKVMHLHHQGIGIDAPGLKYGSYFLSFQLLCSYLQLYEIEGKLTV